MVGVVFFVGDVGEAVIGRVFQRRIARSILGTRRMIGVRLFPLLLKGVRRRLASKPCEIRDCVLLSRMETVTEDVPAGLGT